MRLPRAVMGRDEVLSWGYQGRRRHGHGRTSDAGGLHWLCDDEVFDYEQLCLDLRRMAEHVSARIEVG